MELPKVESVDELLANIEVEKFVQDYELGIPLLDLKKKYSISSEKSFRAFLKSIAAMGMIKDLHPDIVKGDEISSISESNNLTSHHDIELNRRIKKELDTSSNTKAQKGNDSYIDDVLLGLETSINKNQLVTSKEDSKNLDEIKHEIMFLWNAGVPSWYICEKLGITSGRFIGWRKKLLLQKRKVATSIFGRTKRLERELISMRIISELDNKGILYLSEIKRVYDLEDTKFSAIVKDNDKLKVCQLVFPSEKRSTHETVLFFGTKAFDSIIYLERKYLFAELINLFTSNPKINSNLDLNGLLQISNDLFRTQLSNDENILITSIWNSGHPGIKNLNKNSTRYYENEIIKLEQLLNIWKDVSSLATKKKLDGNSQIEEELENIDDDYSEEISNEIIRILNSVGVIGISSISLHAKLKQVFPNEVFDMKFYIKRLIEEKTIIRNLEGKMAIYSLSQYQNNNSRISDEDEIFGRLIKHAEYIEELSSLESGKLDPFLNNQSTKIAGTLMARGDTIRPPKFEYELYCDFILKSYPKDIYVKVDLQSVPTDEYLLEFKQKIPPSNSAILITLKETDERANDILSYINARRDKEAQIEIWTKDTLNKIIARLKYEPAFPHSTVRVKKGEYHGLVGIVISNNYSNMSQVVSILGHNTNAILSFRHIEEIPPESKMITESRSYMELLSILKANSDDREFNAGIDIIPNMLGANKTRIDLFPNWNGFRINDDDNSNDLPQDFCRKKVVSCDCIMWNDQNSDVMHLCRHLIASLLNSWSKSQNVDSVIEGVRNVRFFVHDTFIIYRFFMLLILNGSYELYQLLVTLLRMKLDPEYEVANFDQLLSAIESKISSTENSSDSDQGDTSTKNPKNGIDFSSLNEIPNLDSVKALEFLANKSPELNEVFKRLKSTYITGCINSIEELNNIFLTNRKASLSEIEHFVIEFMRYEGVPSEKSTPLVHIAWNNQADNIQDCVIFVRSALKA